jgi:Putative prokaryotic signal transducing protein
MMPCAMIESEERPPEPDFGPPVLLKRLGNAVEANLAKSKLATAGIPSFLGGENVFAGDLMHPLPYRSVEIYVPESMVHDALDVLDAPTELDDFEPFLDEDPARPLAFRALVTAVAGWVVFFLTIFGTALAIAAFVYSIGLAVGTIVRSTHRTSSIVVQASLAFVLSLVGLGASAVVLVTVLRS